MKNNIINIFTKEFMGYFTSPMAYIFLIVFSLVNGYFFSNTFFLIGQSDLRALFNIVPMVYLFFIPAITMSLIAREKNLGTMEVIATLPIKEYEFVLGKYFAALGLIVVGLLFTSIHFLTLVNFGTNIDYGALFTGYLGLFFAGAVYASMGTFASSLFDNQVVAFIIAVFLVLLFFLFDKLLIFVPSFMAAFIQYLSVDYHISNMSRGVIDSRNIIYFISVIGMFLFATVQVLASRKWK
jgi:ABC-2 type transport system permease protein